MDNTGTDSDNHHLNRSPSRADNNQAAVSDENNANAQNPKQNGQGGSSHSKYSNGPHIRSRITVVCAECKRLKLKCDRRTPCSSCLKRDTVQRCIYSQAATEKIDVQSLHNRLLVVEGTLSQLSSAAPSTSISNAFANMPPFKSSYPSLPTYGQPFGSSSSFTQAVSGSFNSAGTSHASGSGVACNEHALLALGSSGSAVVFSMEDVSSIWLSELNLAPGQDRTDAGRSTLSSFSIAGGRSGSSKPAVKLEPTSMVLPSTPPNSALPSGYMASSPSGSSSVRFSQSPAFIPPLPYSTFIPTSTSSNQLSPSSYSSATSNPYSYPSRPYSTSLTLEVPQVTPALLAHLPSNPLTRTRLMNALSDVMALHPCFNVPHFKHRIEAMIAWGQSPDSSSMQAFDPGSSHAQMNKIELARDLFLGDPGKRRDQLSFAGSNVSPKPTLSFFSATAAAFALGALVSRDSAVGIENGGAGDSALSHAGIVVSPGHAHNPTGKEAMCNPAAMFALSDQALGLFEKTNPYDVDSLVAMILQVLYQLHDGQSRVAQNVFPLVGKMINVARMMGLPNDPDEFPGTFSLFEAETRRRVWWDIFYLDVFISDGMGHPTLIADNTFSTKLPADVDEEKFSPSSTSLPLTGPSDEECENSSAYMVLKCRLAQLMKSVKKQMSKESHTDDNFDLSNDQAASVESDITNWLSDLPMRYRLDLGSESSSSSSATPLLLIAQRCELVMAANRMILKLYLPFLRDANGHSPNKPSHQAVLGTINAAHSIIHASRQLHSACQETRPALFDYYDFGRVLFDAAVVCAHAIIQQPTSILATEAMKNVDGALQIMREWGTYKYAADGAVEGLKVIEVMKQKAEIARGGSSSDDGSNPGIKRKRMDFEDNTFDAGFQLPFVGASVTSVRTDQAKPMLIPSRPTLSPSKESSMKTSTKSSKDKEEKGSRYPTIGIRVRPGQGRPTNRQRTESIPPMSPVDMMNSHTVTTTMVEPQLVAHHAQQAQAQTQSSPMSLSEPSMRGLGYPSPHNTPETHPVQQGGYSSGFAGHEETTFVDQRRYSGGSSSHSTGAFEQQTTANSPYSPTNHSLPYHPTASAEGYYVTYPPPVGPPQPMYDSSGVGHTQDMSMSDYSGRGPSVSMEPSLPNTPNDQPYGIPHEQQHMNPSYPQYMQKSDLAPPTHIHHEYQQAANHSMQVSGTPIHGWVHANPNTTEMWTHPSSKYAINGIGSG